MELEESGSLTSDYTTKLQSAKQNDTGTKTEIQINRTRQKAPKINLCTYGQLIYDKGGKSIQWNKTVFSTSRHGKTGQLHVNNEIKTFSNMIWKINSKEIKDLNATLDTTKLLEENRQNTLT